ncbi:MAG TPA: CopD family protein [Tepidisphaeraceae bacterium]
MHNHSPVSFWFAITRACHFASCLLLLAGFVFDRSIAASVLADSTDAQQSWNRIFRDIIGLTLPASLLTGGWWFALTAIVMSGLPAQEALAPENLAIIWNQTHFSLIWKIRLAIWCATVAITPFFLISRPGSPRRAVLAWLGLLCCAALSGAMAWTGHAMMSDQRSLHLAADLIHIVVGGIWPISLIPFILLLHRLGYPKTDAHWKPIAQITRRFSTMCLIAVTILTASGIVNTWLLLGSPKNFLTPGWGRALLWKLIAVAAMIALGAINRVYLRRMESSASNFTNTRKAHAFRWLKINVMIEILLAAAVLIAVGYLGLLPPSSQAAL